MKERIMALSGIFQATELVRQAANHGTWSGYSADTCLESLLAIELEIVVEHRGEEREDYAEADEIYENRQEDYA